MPDKKYLVVVDMQKDFIDGSLGTEEAQAIVPAAAARIRDRRAAGYRLIATLDTHGENYLDTPEGKKLPVKHCVKGTSGWQLNPVIREALGEDCLLLEKPTFGSVRLPEIIGDGLEAGDSLTVEFLGLCTDICVVSNVLLIKAHFPDGTIRVKADCCAGVTPQKHLAALDTMASCQIDLI